MNTKIAAKKKKGLIQELKKRWFFYLIPLPGIIYLILFCYIPMAGLYVVFERYTYQGGLLEVSFVGLANFKFFFMNIKNALRATRNTLVINGVSIILGTVINVALAIAINDWIKAISKSYSDCDALSLFYIVDYYWNGCACFT